MATDIRVEPEEVDPAWVTQVLEEAGVARGAEITNVEFAGYVGTGQMSRNGRFHLEWSHPEGRPLTAVAKFPSADPATRASSFQNGAYLNEYLFYTRVASSVSVRTPKCWVARYDAEAQRCILLMEDLIDSEQGDQFASCSEADAELVLEQAAGLHAPRWGDPELATIPFLPPAESRGETLSQYYQAAATPCLARLGHAFSDDVVATVEHFGTVMRRWAAGTETRHTITHGDFRPDNFLFGRRAEAPKLAVVDWQTAATGVGPTDIAYFIGGAYPEQSRRSVELTFLEQYRQRLLAAGVSYTAQDCLQDYRWGALWGLLVGVTASLLAEQTERGDRLFTLMISRHAQHALDLESVALVERA